MTDETIRAYADALFPADGPIPISGSDAGAVPYMRAYLARSQPRTRRLIRLLITATEMGPLLFGPRRARFTRLSRAEQQTFIAEGYVSRIYLRRVTVLTMRALLTMAYFADARVRAHIGIDDGEGIRPARDDVPAPMASGTRLIDPDAAGPEREEGAA